ncbi:hypothetical protein J42TS3_45110 [Paenibacillus vini]|uniref:Uncharacterized protein n=1 Tax=Paenibacillus vini TaxID=1476024 RepID=A0ABQ4MHK9_9BACL|nr:hypothetical protein J42TS3_45110 [Paenibacillus vini]
MRLGFFFVLFFRDMYAHIISEPYGLTISQFCSLMEGYEDAITEQVDHRDFVRCPNDWML